MNTLSHVFQLFQSELKNLYDKKEIDQFVFLIGYFEFKVSKFKMLQSRNEPISANEYNFYSTVLDRLKKREPIQYILGKTEFYNLFFTVNKNTLIPRSETEELVDLIIAENVSKTSRIIDIGTGSGCIAVALKKNIKEADVFALDISDEALKVAKKNAEINHTTIQFINQSIFDIEGMNQVFDIIVSNPPYVLEEEKKMMHANVLNFEPHLALFVSNENPLLYYKAIVEFAEKSLIQNGKIYLEINPNQSVNIQLLAKESGYCCQLVRDMSNKERIAVLWKLA